MLPFCPSPSLPCPIFTEGSILASSASFPTFILTSGHALLMLAPIWIPLPPCGCVPHQNPPSSAHHLLVPPTHLLLAPLRVGGPSTSRPVPELCGWALPFEPSFFYSLPWDARCLPIKLPSEIAIDD